MTKYVLEPSGCSIKKMPEKKTEKKRLTRMLLLQFRLADGLK